MISTDPYKKKKEREKTKKEEFTNMMLGLPRTVGDLIPMTVRDNLDRNTAWEPQNYSLTFYD